MILNRLETGVMLSGKSHGTCHFQSVSTQAESSSYGEWQVPWDLPFSQKKIGKSHGTCHFPNNLMIQPVLWGKWQVPWDLPLSKRVDTG